MTDRVNLDELEALAKAATPGPWHREMIELGPGGPLTLGIGSAAAPVCIVNGIVESPRGNRDVALILAMRNQLDALIAEVREHRAKEKCSCGRALSPGLCGVCDNDE